MNDAKVCENNRATEVSEVKDKYYVTTMLEEAVQCTAGQSFEISIMITNDSDGNCLSWRGAVDSSDAITQLPNTHNDLFKLSYSNRSGNGTGETCGNLPEIFYFLE